jgi:hypothetical protein
VYNAYKEKGKIRPKLAKKEAFSSVFALDLKGGV